MSGVADAPGGLINSAAVGVAYAPPSEPEPAPTSETKPAAKTTTKPAPEPVPPPAETTEST